MLKKFGPSSKLTVAKAVIVRAVFLIHVLVSVYRVVVAYSDVLFWLLLISLIGLLTETVVTLVKRSGREWTWFSPAIFCYLIAAVPPIWLLELHNSQLRRQPNNLTTNSSTNGVEITETIGIEIPLDQAGWTLAMEQALLFILILGRWFMPKGNISKNQLSQILLVYIGMAADIMELFEVFKEDEVATSLVLTYPTLTLWSVALFQYTLAMGTAKEKKQRYGGIEEGEEEHASTEEEEDYETTKCGLDDVKIDVLGIMTTIIMQDGPFLCFRLYLMAGVGILSQMMVFFTCKNLLVIVLQIYRLFVIYFEAKKEEKSTSVSELNMHQNVQSFPPKDTSFPVDHTTPEYGNGYQSNKNVNSVNLNGPKNPVAPDSTPANNNNSATKASDKNLIGQLKPDQTHLKSDSKSQQPKKNNQQPTLKKPNNRVSPIPPDMNSIRKDSWKGEAQQNTNVEHPSAVVKEKYS